mgnify:CR=1 FL=1|jgi:hypothetical protein
MILKNIQIVMLLLALVAGCAESPEECVKNAFGALCAGDPEGFKKRLTPPSVALYEGLSEFSPAAFSCTAGSEMTVVETGGVREGLRILEVTTVNGTMDVAVVQSDGTWRLDLFLSEESAFYSGRKEEIW